MKGVNPDIVIFAFNLQSFPSVCRQIIEHVTAQTVCINCVFGLQRKRIYRILKITTVFRSYVEGYALARRLEKELKELLDTAKSRVHTAVIQSALTEYFGDTTPRPDTTPTLNKSPSVLAAFKANLLTHESDEDDQEEEDDDDYEEYRSMTPVEEAAELIAKRYEENIADIIKLVEYFYSLRGKCRAMQWGVVSCVLYCIVLYCVVLNCSVLCMLWLLCTYLTLWWCRDVVPPGPEGGGGVGPGGRGVRRHEPLHTQPTHPAAIRPRRREYQCHGIFAAPFSPEDHPAGG